MSGGRIALLVVGVIFLVGALVLAVGGGGLIWLSMTAENDNPMFAPRTTSLKEADAYAVVSEPFQIDWYDESQGDGWGLGDSVTVTVEAESNDSSMGVFVGIARDTDVDNYLGGVRYYETTEWTSDPYDDPEVQRQPHSGTLAPSDPTTEAFWEVSTHGTGRQTLEWKPEMGKWVLVIMNEDGSAGIDMNGAVGTELPWLFWLGLGLWFVGVLALVGGVIMVCFAARRPKQPVPPMRAAT
jgi:hypothetical protein